MNQFGILYIIVGVVALIGALVGAYVNISIGAALEFLSAPAAAELPAGTDLSGLQESAKSVGTILTMAWIWIIAVILASAICIKTGLKMLKGK